VKARSERRSRHHVRAPQVRAPAIDRQPEMSARQRSGSVAAISSLIRALTVLVTALVYRPLQRVLALGHTSPTEVGEVPSRATGEHD
jgi:hypothetical protein